MILAKPLIKGCPKCKKPHAVPLILSGNTIGSALYSDSERTSPLLPIPKPFSKCSHCNHFFQTNSAIAMRSDSLNVDTQKLPAFKKPDAFDFTMMMLGYDKKTSPAMELNLRILHHRAFNDRVREGKPIFEEAYEKSVYESNCRKIIEMQNPSNEDEWLFISELYRNIGEFQKARETLKKVTDQKYSIIKDKLCKVILEGKTEVIRIY